MTPDPFLRAVRGTVAWCVGRSGMAAALLRRREGGALCILTYHRVNDPAVTYGPCVSPGTFNAHISYLADHFAVRQLQDIVTADQAGRPLPDVVFAVTFDDGYADIAEHAYPVLRRYGVPASVYVAGSVIGTEQLLWTDQVELIVRRAVRTNVTIQAGDKSHCFRLTDDVARRNAVLRLWSLMKTLPDGERRAANDRLAQAAGVVPGDYRAPGLMLQWEQLRQMEPSIMEVGSHTLTHMSLTTAAREDVEREIVESKPWIEERLGRPIYGFTYPSDSHAPWMTEIVKRAGFLYACYVGGRMNARPIVDSFGLYRVHVENWSLPVFQAEISAYGEQIRSLRWRLRCR